MQVEKSKQVIENIVNENISLTERIRIFVSEQGITIVSVCASLLWPSQQLYLLLLVFMENKEDLLLLVQPQ